MSENLFQSNDQTVPQVVVLSSDDENESSSSNENSSIGKDSSSVISVEDESADSDCEILSVEDLQGEEKWRDVHGPFRRLNALIQAGFNDPRILLVRVFGMDESSLPSDPNHLLSLLLSLLSEPAPRSRLHHVNNIDHVVHLLNTCTSILVITGAGISVSCGIPDFRSRDGIYACLSRQYPDLSSPQAMFDMSYFKKNPTPFFKFAKDIFPGQFTPSITHRLIALLESKNKLLRNYTQNIDTLEQAAGITRLIQCHGSFASATCTTCKLKVPCSAIKEAVFNQTIPHCPVCWPNKSTSPSTSQTDCLSPNHTDNQSPDILKDEQTAKNLSNANLPIKESKHHKISRKNPSYGVLKPDIVFFGEGLSNEFHDALAEDVKQTDLVFVIGSSLKVRPVAHIPNAIPPNIPQILINREPLTNHDFDVELLGDCDVIVSELCVRSGWELPGLSNRELLKEIPLNSLKNCLCHSKSAPQINTIKSTSSNQNEEVESRPSQSNNENDQIVEKKSQLIDTDSSGTSQPKECLNGESKNSVELNQDEKDFDTDDEEDSVWEVASCLPPNSFTRIPPNQFVFPGAEIYLSRNADLDLFDSSTATTPSHSCEDVIDSTKSPTNLVETSGIDSVETDSNHSNTETSSLRNTLKRYNQDPDSMTNESRKHSRSS